MIGNYKKYVFCSPGSITATKAAAWLAAAMVAMAMGRARQNDPLRPIEPLE